MATRRPMRSSMALYTTPMPPLPRTSTTLYLPICVGWLAAILVLHPQDLSADADTGAHRDRSLATHAHERPVAAAHVFQKEIFTTLIHAAMRPTHKTIVRKREGCFAAAHAQRAATDFLLDPDGAVLPYLLHAERGRRHA